MILPTVLALAFTDKWAQYVGGMECPLTSARVVEIAASFGFSIAVLVYCAASFSGTNPAIIACRPYSRVSE